MHVINARNVNDAYIQGMNLMNWNGKPRPSRNGPVRKTDGPVATIYHEPNERVLFDAKRDCNPFFHYLESMWMLLGRNDVASMKTYNARIANFSDDGRTFNGAYGFRWRVHFGYDQLQAAIDRLRKDKYDRRVVVTMWEARDLIDRETKDVPCNLSLKFGVDDNGRLDMICFNRSNDMIWGAYGANSVHMSFVHEYVAICSGLQLGKYTQISADFHVYEDIYLEKFDQKYVDNLEALLKANPYQLHYTNPSILGRARGEPFADGHELNTDLYFLDLHWNDTRHIASQVPKTAMGRDARLMILAHEAWNNKKIEFTEQFNGTMEYLAQMEQLDWRDACTDWVSRRYAVRAAKGASK